MTRTVKKTNDIFETRAAHKFLAMAERISVEPKKLYKEVLRLHEERYLRTFAGKNKRPNAKMLMRANSQEQSTRSRLVRIILDCKEVTDIVEPMQDAVILQLITKYPEMFPVTTKTERREFLIYGFSERLPFIREVKKVIQAAEYVIEDIDQSGFNLNRSKDLYELSSRPDLA